MEASPRVGPVAGAQRVIQSNNSQKKRCYKVYIHPKDASRGLETGELFQGSLRINPRNYVESYVDNPAGNWEQDVLVLGLQDRNRALNGDIVVLRLKPRCQWLVRDAMYNAWLRESGGGTASAVVNSGGSDGVVEGSTQSECTPPASETEQTSPSSTEQSDDSLCVKRYTREQMVNIATNRSPDERKNGGPIVRHEVDAVAASIESLSVSNPRPTLENSTVLNAQSSESASTPERCRLVGPSTSSGALKRNNYRFVSSLPREQLEIPDSCLQKTAEVVFIKEAKNRRIGVGTLKTMADGNRRWALFSPGDSRMPRMMISAEQLPVGFFERPQDFTKFIYAARIVEWPETAQFARGMLCKNLGMAGDIDAETEGMLIAHEVDTREYTPEALASLPVCDATKWSVDQKELDYRRDFREETVFTIDPITARDLDDALHIRVIRDCDGYGTPGFEVGVHIADVSFFVHERTMLDRWAAERATSVYLVHQVVPMLPRVLCEELCSLNPGVDRLTFSVVWKMDDRGRVHDEWFGRTVIRSCCKLAYEHAQDFIANPEKDFTVEEFPEIFNGRQLADIKKAVILLNTIAESLRAKRCAEGSLRLDQPKLRFAFDELTGLPNGVTIYERQKAHSLVEEFMLLANMAVARQIESVFPKCALLRRHPPPKAKVLRDIQQLCEKIGFPMNGSSSAAISSGLRRYEGDSELQRTIVQVLSHLIMKAMQLAVYFCTGTLSNRSQYAHYALSVPFYTHFTSPIRRYPDIIVHRQLAAALGYSRPLDLNIREIESLAVHCNDKKLAAKNVSEESDEMFFGVFVKECGPLKERAVVLQVLDLCFDVLVIKFGVLKRVYINRLGNSREPDFVEEPLPHVTIFWDTENGVVEQCVRMCTVLDVTLSALPEPTKYQATIERPTKTEVPLSLSELADDL